MPQTQQRRRSERTAGARTETTPARGASARRSSSRNSKPAAFDVVAWLFPAAIAAVIGVVVGVQITGASAPRALSDPGALVRWGLPAAQVTSYMAMASVIGCLVFAAFFVPRYANARRSRKKDKTDNDDAEHPAFRRIMTAAAASAVVWTLSAVVVTVLTYSDVSGTPVSIDETYTAQLTYFITELGAGQAWLVITVIAALVSTLALGVRSVTGIGITALLAIIALIPLSLIGHSASAGDHEAAVSSLGLHLIGICLWVGGVIALAICGPVLGKLSAATLIRFSSLALAAYLLVFASGVINASIRLEDWSHLTSPYGVLVILKTIATLALGVVGFAHRRWIIPKLSDGTMSSRRVMIQVITGELVLMAATMGLGTALSRSPTPAPENLLPDASPAFLLTGYDLPPELTTARLFTEWRIDWLWVAAAIIGAVAYLRGYIALRRRGDKTNVLQLISWLIGCVLLVYVTSGGLAVYGRFLFSVHMIDHMALTMVVPLFLVLGAPVTLALRSIRPRTDGTRGIREWLLVFTHSKFAAFVTNPIVVAGNFVGSIIIFYYSPLFGFALREHLGHELMILHFLLTGYLFLLVLIGTDPLPKRPAYPLRLVILLATMAFHAFFGVALMGSTSLLEASYFGNLGRTWGPSPIEDQQLGGAWAWGIGEIPTVIVAFIVAVMWSRSDSRESRRSDRAADRNNEADLNAYNDMFARLNASDGAPESTAGSTRTTTSGPAASSSPPSDAGPSGAKTATTTQPPKERP